MAPQDTRSADRAGAFRAVRLIFKSTITIFKCLQCSVLRLRKQTEFPSQKPQLTSLERALQAARVTRSVSGARDLTPGLGAGRRPRSRLFHRDWGVTEAAVCGGPRPGFRALSAATGGTQPPAGGDAGVRRGRT